MFSVEERVKMLEEVTKDIANVKIIPFEGLLVDFAHKLDAKIVIRGLRAITDFEYELQMGYANASLWDEIETLYLMPSLKHAFISSSVVRSVLKHGGDVNHLIPQAIIPLLKERFKCM